MDQVSRLWDRSRTLLLILAILAASGLVGLRPSLYLLILLGGACGLALLIQQPALGLAVMTALSFSLPLEIGTGSEVALTPPAFLIPAVALVWLVDSLRKRSLRLPASRTTLPLLLFVGSGLLSLLAGNVYWDPAVPRAGNLLMVQVAQLSIFALSAAIFLLAGDWGRQTRWLQCAIWIFLILAGVVVSEFYSPWLHSALGGIGLGRAARTSMFWTWLAALSTGQLLFNRHLTSFAKLALLALFASSGYLVWFRMNEWTSALGPFTVAALTVAWLRVWRHSHTIGFVAIVVAIALAIALYPVLFTLSGGERELEYSWGGRLALYQAVLDLVKDHPILGLGPAAYRHYGYVRPLSMGLGRAFYVQPRLASHNNYIDIYAQMGLVGLGLFLWFLIELGLLSWRLTSRFKGDFADGYVQGALGGLAGSLVAMLLVDWFLPFVYNVGFRGFRTSALAWMFLGGLVALGQIADSEDLGANMADSSRQ